ncbi:hypothetical protein [Neisseria subflava]
MAFSIGFAEFKKTSNLKWGLL